MCSMTLLLIKPCFFIFTTCMYYCIIVVISLHTSWSIHFPLSPFISRKNHHFDNPHYNYVCLGVLVGMWQLSKFNHTKLYNNTHNALNHYVFKGITKGMKKLDLHDNVEWQPYIESEFTYQFDNNKPKFQINESLGFMSFKYFDHLLSPTSLEGVNGFIGLMDMYMTMWRSSNIVCCTLISLIFSIGYKHHAFKTCHM